MQTIESTVYIDFLNKDNQFKKDRIYFDTWEDAKIWAIANFEKFNPDIINYI